MLMVYPSSPEMKPIFFYHLRAAVSAALSESIFPIRPLLFQDVRTLVSPLGMKEHFSVVIQCRELAGNLSFWGDDFGAIEGLALASLTVQQQVLVVTQIPSEYHTAFPVQQKQHFMIDCECL